jgi:archaellum component FlaC
MDKIDFSTFLNNKQDYQLIDEITFGDFADLKNIKEQTGGILFKLENIENNFQRTLDFLTSSVSSVLYTSSSLDMVEARIINIKEAINFILKTRFEIAENSKGVSIVDLSKGDFSDLFFNVSLKGITFGKV